MGFFCFAVWGRYLGAVPFWVRLLWLSLKEEEGASMKPPLPIWMLLKVIEPPERLFWASLKTNSLTTSLGKGKVP
jgi:hypothetical protein